MHSNSSLKGDIKRIAQRPGLIGDTDALIQDSIAHGLLMTPHSAEAVIKKLTRSGAYKL